ncbi:MAG: phosphoribosylformylglycinamidine synthase subunit PurS [Acidobacteriota bacterium]
MSKKNESNDDPVTVEVTVYPRPEILDPQGKAIAGALGRLGFDGIADVRAGKSFRLRLEGVSADEALERAEEMADKLLANTVVEDFEVELVDEEAP